MIEFSHIEKSFFGVKVLKDVSFTVKPGQTLGIVGENGAGKSTLMNILGGNLRADAGAMRLSGQPYVVSGRKRVFFRAGRDTERGGWAANG
jgi:ribose transport system ATP-binding protein